MKTKQPEATATGTVSATRDCAGACQRQGFRLVTIRQIEAWAARGNRCPSCHYGRKVA